jgi:hypothetical protein
MIRADAIKAFSKSERRFGYHIPNFFPKEIGKIIGVELGVYEGKHSSLMLSRHKQLYLHCVDMWDLWATRKTDYPGDLDSGVRKRMEDTEKSTEVYYSAMDLLKQYKLRVNVIKENTVIAANNFKNESIDFVYIDGDHTYDGCLKDIEAWYPKLKTTGIMAGHDYMRMRDDRGVYRAVNHFAKLNDLAVIPNGRKKLGGGCWLYA